MMTDNVFLKILDKKIPARIVHDDEHCLAFHDINPQAPVHVLIIPKIVIRTHDDLQPTHAGVIAHLHQVAIQLARQLKLEAGYRLVINCKDDGGQTVPHLHVHLLGGRAMTWPPG